ncbi:MAG: hypothetical protein Q9160_008532 [Pyrenula sp. 1 TL-2023]
MSSQQKLLIVIGATGAQGGSVLSAFGADPAWCIRALTRNPRSSSAQALASLPNVEVAHCSASDPASLRAAFSGANAIFAVTDFWGILSSLASEVKEGKTVHEEGSKTLNETARDIEVEYAKNIFAAAAAEVGEGVLERLVWSSLPYTTRHTEGKYTRVYHFDGKAMATEYLLKGGKAGELTGLAARTSVVWIGCYAENHANMPPFKIQKTGLFVSALLNEAHPAHSSIPRGVALRASTISLSPADFMNVWSETLQLPGRYEEVAMEDFAASIEDLGLRGEIIDTLGMHAEYGYFGGNDEVEASVGPEEVGIETPGIEGLKEWIRTADWSGVAGKLED